MKKHEVAKCKLTLKYRQAVVIHRSVRVLIVVLIIQGVQTFKPMKVSV